MTGLGVVVQSGESLQSAFSKSLRLGGGDLGPRLGRIYEGVCEAIDEHQPDVVVIEKVFLATNAQAALVLGHARGSAMCAAVSRGVPIVEYTALQVKRAVVGTGGASKAQVQHMVRVLLGMRTSPPQDAADALACAICHIHTAAVEARQLSQEVG